MSQIGPILLSVVGLFLTANSLIFAHEFGHYAIARITGVTARRFALGVGPRVFEWTDRRGMVWSLLMLPMAGMFHFQVNTTQRKKADISVAHLSRGWRSSPLGQSPTSSW